MFGFHVVKISYNGRFRGYEIWYNNRRLLNLKMGLKLKRHEAYAYARQLNGE